MSLQDKMNVSAKPALKSLKTEVANELGLANYDQTDKGTLRQDRTVLQVRGYNYSMKRIEQGLVPFTEMLSMQLLQRARFSSRERSPYNEGNLLSDRSFIMS